MDDSVSNMSGAERTLRERTPTIIERVMKGATLPSALRVAGYERGTIKRIITIGAGGLPEVTDDGLREACGILAQHADAAAAEVDAALAERWKFLAMVGDDWRGIAELLKRRNPEEWLVTEKSQVELAGGVDIRSEDAVLGALQRLRDESNPSPTEPTESTDT